MTTPAVASRAALLPQWPMHSRCASVAALPVLGKQQAHAQNPRDPRGPSSFAISSTRSCRQSSTSGRHHRRAETGSCRNCRSLARIRRSAICSRSSSTVAATASRTEPAANQPQQGPNNRRAEPNNPRQNPGQRRGQSAGSGFVIDAAGIVITNNHVIGEANDITVIFSDGQRLRPRSSARMPRSISPSCG